MLFVKKMCVLRQVRAGFSDDGRQVSGVVKVEQYDKNLAVEVSVVGFAPLFVGEYYCLIADANDRVELLPLRGKCLFNLVSELDVKGGFCAVVCLVKNGVTPIAYGVSGNREYDFDKLIKAAPKERLNARFYTAIGDGDAFSSADNVAKRYKNDGGMYESTSNTAKNDGYVYEDIDVEKPYTADGDLKNGAIAHTPYRENKIDYDDEMISREDYFNKESEDEFKQTTVRNENEGFAVTRETEADDARQTAANDDHAENVCKAFKPDLAEQEPTYYRSVKDEIDEIFAKYEPDDTLSSAFPYSKWVKVKEVGKADYLIGIVYEEGEPLYVCYAFPAKDKGAPPPEIAETCAFVPLSPFSESDGCFVIFQSTSTGECIKLQRA